MSLSQIPNEIRRDVFGYMDRDQLDACELVSAKWHKLLSALAGGVLALRGISDFRIEAVCQPMTMTR
ncbi:hypothetical protein AAVH_20263 [Aphelenchoides avenae]|nr:hypothetical protein AAVH_20263 [Aphelenchus avenae]